MAARRNRFIANSALLEVGVFAGVIKCSTDNFQVRLYQFRFPIEAGGAISADRACLAGQLRNPAQLHQVTGVVGLQEFHEIQDGLVAQARVDVMAP